MRSRVLVALVGALTAYCVDAYSIEVIPFVQKFSRQEAGVRGHVFTAQERVSAPFIIHFEDGIKLQVAENVEGGIGDIRHADTFILSDDNRDVKEQLLKWRGYTIQAVVEILNPVEEGFILSNMFNYSARIVSFSEPTTTTNPPKETLSELEMHAEVILRGEVLKLEDKKLILTDGIREYEVTLWHGIPRYMGDLSDEIGNLNHDDKVEVGDQIHLKTILTENGLGASSIRNCYLLKAGDVSGLVEVKG